MSGVCDKVRRLAAHHERLEGIPVDSGLGLGDADLDVAEAEMGRLLPSEVRELYRCMNGSFPFAPHVHFRALAQVMDVWRIGYGEHALPILSNAPGWVERAALFPVLDLDEPGLCVLTTVGARRQTSPVLLVDLLGDQLTVVAYTLEALVSWFLEGFERGDVKVTEHGVFWTTDSILAFPPDMEPLGTPTGDDPLPWVGPWT
jgi:hypothetical protein